MKKNAISYITLAVIFIIVISAAVLFGTKPVIPAEAFTSSSPSCPTSANRTPDGQIVVDPGNKSFKNMEEYVAYLKNIYSSPENATCVPPMVKHVRESIDGVIGGVGNGAIPPNIIGMEGPDRTVLNTADASKPFEKQDIQKLDDYEYSRVFQHDRAPRFSPLSKESKNKLISQNILDWDKLPFSNEKRAEAETEFITGLEEKVHRDPKTGVFFNNMEGYTTIPPDQEALEQREKNILQAYRPTPIDKHIMDDETEKVAKLVNDIYANDPHWEPVVEKVGENQWAVRELRPKARKEKWEDDTSTIDAAINAGSVDPKVRMEILTSQTNDPYFDKSGVADKDNNRFWNYNEFNKWTPGLERMFAPSSDVKEWY
jgi:hypothetical protein